MADNIEKEQTYNDQDQEEFCAVVIPIFTGLTNAYQESQVDSCSFPIEGETSLESVDQTKNSEPAKDQSHTLPHKRTRLTHLKYESMVEVRVADWLNPTPSTSTCHNDQDEDAMWDDKLAALVDEIVIFCWWQQQEKQHYLRFLRILN